MTTEELPSWLSFHPTDEELILVYLKPLTEGTSLPPDKRALIHDFDAYSTEPWKLPGNFRHGKDRNEAFFFSPRHRVFPRGTRVKRTAGNGVWNGGGHEIDIRSGSGEVIGSKSSFAFRINQEDQEVVHSPAVSVMVRRGVHGKKKGYSQGTDYIMHEYLLPAASKAKGDFQDLALCRIYRKNKKLGSHKRIRASTDDFDMACCVKFEEFVFDFSQADGGDQMQDLETLHPAASSYESMTGVTGAELPADNTLQAAAAASSVSFPTTTTTTDDVDDDMLLFANEIEAEMEETMDVD